MDRKFGYLPSPPDKRDYTLDMFVQGVFDLPKIYVLPYTPPIYNQESTGMCAAFTFAEMKEIQEYKERGVAERYSPGFIYGYDSWPFEGMQMRYGLDFLCKSGVCTYEEFPLIADKGTCYKELLKIESPEFKEKAKAQRTKSYLRLNTAEEIKLALYTIGPVACGWLLYESWNRVDRTGRVPVPNKDTEKLIGGHAMLIIGYDDTLQCFIVQNSWGEWWGSKGRCYIPYEYFPNEAWSVADYVPAKWQLDMWLGKKEYIVNGQKKEMDCAPITGENTRTLVPIRLVAEELGCEVEWEQATKKISLIKR